MSASEEELCDGQDCSRDLLALLPAPLLLNNVLPCLDPADLVRLGCCCRCLRAAAFADDVWRPLCEALGWGGFPGGTSWQAGFSSRRRALCVECGRPSRYVFALIGCRLCEKCEHRSPRYGLVTALEAAERYGVPYAALAALPYHEACSTRFYLRSAVEAIARGGGGVRRKQLSEGNDSEEEEEEEEEEGEAAAQCAGSDDSSNDEGGVGDRAGRGSTAADLRRAEEKAARKAAKKAAKEAQRLKRQGRNTPGAGVGGGAGGGVGSGRRQQQQQPQSAAGGRGGPAPHCGGPRRRGGGAAAAAAPAGSSPPWGLRRAAGPLLLVQDDGDDGATLPLEGQAVPLHRSRARGGGHGGGASGGGSRPAAVKLKSGWAAEREALMAAWGQFGISGLVLAS